MGRRRENPMHIHAPSRKDVIKIRLMGKEIRPNLGRSGAGLFTLGGARRSVFGRMRLEILAQGRSGLRMV